MVTTELRIETGDLKTTGGVKEIVFYRVEGETRTEVLRMRLDDAERLAMAIADMVKVARE